MTFRGRVMAGCAAMLACGVHREPPVVLPRAPVVIADAPVVSAAPAANAQAAVGISDARLARAIAARRTPDLVLPDPPVTSIGRCAVEIGRRAAETGERARAEFLTRHRGWRVDSHDLDEELGTVRHAFAPADGSVGARVVPMADDEAVKLAFDFLASSYDLFGLSLIDLAHVRINPGRPQDDKTMIARTILIEGDAPQPGYEQFAALGRTWLVQIELNGAGTLRAVHVVAHKLLPPIHLCTEPRLTADEAKLAAHVVGTHLTYSDFSGRTVDAGQVAERDIKSITLTVHRDNDGGATRLRLAYLVVVKRGPLSWSFVIDADTGVRLVFRPDFVS